MNIEQLQLFEEQTIRTAWDEENEEWYFSIVDVVGALTEQTDYDAARNYWKVLKIRLKEEGNELVTNCNQLKMKSPKDGKNIILMLPIQNNFFVLFNLFLLKKQNHLNFG